MGPILEIKNLSFRYPEQPRKALSDIHLQVEQGEFLVICGPSGCGKSTLLRLIKKETQPFGEMEGEMCYKQTPLEEADPRETVQEVAMVWQDPENQIVMEQVHEELVFAMETLGYPTKIMRKRLAEMVQFFGLEGLLTKKTDELSGGQKQLINLASVLLLQPKVLLLDEPTAQLDPVSGREFLQILKKINEEFGMTIVLVEHRLDEVFSLADRLMVMNEGAICYKGKPNEVTNKIWRKRDERFFPYLPSITRVYLQIEEEPHPDKIPFNVKEGRKWLAGKRERLTFREPFSEADSLQQRVILQARNIDYRYAKESPMVLNGLNLDVYTGDFLAIVGGNGAGKSTMLQLMAGLFKPNSGKVMLEGQKISKIKTQELYRRVAYLPQNPLSYFAYDTVEQELFHARRRFYDEKGPEFMQNVMDQLGIEPLLSKHPHDCSGGERQKVALACLLLSRPEVILLDEPTKGMDPLSKLRFGEMIRQLHQQGLTLVMVTHDIEFAARSATRCAMLFEGMITAEGTPSEFFSGNFFYTTNVNRMSREWLPKALTDEEVLREWRVPSLPSS